MSLLAYLNYFLWNYERVLGFLMEATAAVIDRWGVLGLKIRGFSSSSSVPMRRNHGMLLMGVDGGADLVLTMRIGLLKVAEWAEGVRFKGDARLSQLRHSSNTSSSHREGGVQVRCMIWWIIVKVDSCASLVFGDHLISGNICIGIKSRWSKCWRLPLTPDIWYLYLSRLHLISYSSLMGNCCGLSELRKNNLSGIWRFISSRRFNSITSALSWRP